MDKIARVLIISSDKNLKEVLNFCFDGWGYEVFLQEPLANDTTPIKKCAPDVIVMDVHSASKSQLEVCHLLKDDFTTNFIPVITLINKRQLRAHLLNLKYGVDDYLIKPPDPLDLRVRIEMAMRRAQYSFYASPLTGLPGGRIIEEIVKDRLSKNAAFSFAYVDIDNFKYFNDVYGYHKGDKVIMQTAHMLYTSIKRFGNKADFIGHIGGDDFVFISSPDAYKRVCQNFILMFDRITPFHYSAQDRKHGFIIASDRSRTVKKVPLMTVSVAVVNKKSHGDLKNIVEISEKVAEIKHYLKVLPGSKFMADRRNPHADLSSALVASRKDDALNVCKPLGQILLEKNIISCEQLDEALGLHWKRGVVLGEVLKELGFVREEELADVLSIQQAEFARAFNLTAERKDGNKG